MMPVQQVDVVGPMMAEVYALLPYVVLAMIAGTNIKTGLDVMGQAMEDRRPKLHAVLGILLAALNCVLAWVLFVGLQISSSEFMGRASIEATARRLEDTPDVILGLAQVQPWTLVTFAFVLFFGFLLAVGRPAKRTRNRRRDWEEV